MEAFFVSVLLLAGLAVAVAAGYLAVRLYRS